MELYVYTDEIQCIEHANAHSNNNNKNNNGNTNEEISIYINSVVRIKIICAI